MSGFIKPAVKKRVVDFAGIPSGSTQELILADRVDLIEWPEATLMLKIHSHSLSSGAGTIKIGAYGQSVSEDDPGVAFLDTLTAFYFTTLNNLTPSPAYFTVGNVYHPLLRLVAQGTRTAAGALNATVSIEFSLKDA